MNLTQTQKIQVGLWSSNTTRGMDLSLPAFLPSCFGVICLLPPPFLQIPFDNLALNSWQGGILGPGRFQKPY